MAQATTTPAGMSSNSHHRLWASGHDTSHSTKPRNSTSAQAPMPTATPVAAERRRKRPPARSATPIMVGIRRQARPMAVTAVQGIGPLSP